jgi:hypothetical protein
MLRTSNSFRLIIFSKRIVFSSLISESPEKTYNTPTPTCPKRAKEYARENTLCYSGEYNSVEMAEIKASK